MILKNILSMGTMRLVSAALTMGLLVAAARIWGMSSLGGFTLLTTIFMFCQLLPLLGLHLYLIREVSANPELAITHGSTASWLALAISMVLCLVLGLGGPMLYPDQAELHVPIWLIGLSLLPTAPIVVVESVLMAQQRMGIVAKTNIIENVLRTTVVLALIFSGYGFNAIFVVFLVLRCLVLLRYLFLDDAPKVLSIHGYRKDVLRQYVGRAPLFLAIVFCSSLTSRLDVLVLSKVATPHELGLYASPSKLFEVGLMVPQVLMVVLFPKMTTIFAESANNLSTFLADVIRFATMLAWPLLISLSMVATPLLLVFGSAATGGHAMLVLLLFALLGAGVNQLLATSMLVVNRPDLDLKTLMSTAVATALVLAVAVPKYGAEGAAGTVLMMSVFASAMRVYLLRGVLPLREASIAIAKTTLAGLTMLATVTLLSDWNALGAYVAGLLVYLGLVLGLRILQEAELQRLKGAINARWAV